MRRFALVVAAVVGLTTGVTAQQPPWVQGADAPLPQWRFRAAAGVFAPTVAIVAVDSRIRPNVELESGTAISAEIVRQFRPDLAAYAGLTHHRSWMDHVGTLVFQAPFRRGSPVNVTTPTLGVQYRRDFGLGFEPTLRLGVGVKFYEFNLREVEGGVQDFTGDIGLGLSSRLGHILFNVEARWLPSQFDARMLPMRDPVISNGKQWQHDILFTLGFSLPLMTPQGGA